MSTRDKFKEPMTPDEFQKCLDAAGLAQKQYAAMVGVTPIAIAKRKSGESNIPPEGAILLRLLAAKPKLVKDAWEAAGKPEGIEVSAAGRPPIRRG
jgi:transcriptional regulator with XRE-family HTH domain